MGKKYLFTSESVGEGHPDKLCDQISDAVLDACIAQDAESRVACETFASGALVLVGGEITTEAYVDVPEIARNVARKVGYTSASAGLDCDSMAVLSSIHTQSPDIDIGVSGKGLAEFAGRQGAGDQGMMFGFACDETPQLMPATISLAHEILRRAAEARKSGALPYLLPDSKSQVTIEYEGFSPVRIDAVVVSHQHADGVSYEKIRRDLIECAVMPAIERTGLSCKDAKFFINPTGRFVAGGPAADTGLTGRKIIVDTYGGAGRHGGGAFSGKDPSKVDRSAAYMARYIAKNVVAAGLARRCEIQLSYAIGVPFPVSIMCETFGTAKADEAQIANAVAEVFDCTPAGIVRSLDLKRPIYEKTATYGHFGRPEFPWENCDKTEELLRRIR